MEIIKYYKKEIFTYWFFSLMPIMIFAETYVYMQAMQSYNPDNMMILSFLFWIYGMISAVLVFIQMISLIRFGIKIRELSPEIKCGIAREVASGIKRGRILLTEDVLIYYGMFSKKVMKCEDIAGWKSDAGSTRTYVPRAGYITMKWNNTNISTKNGKVIVLNSPIDSFDGVSGELPYNSMIAVVLIGLSFVIMTIYPKVMDILAGVDPIERLLFHASYDAYFWLTSIVIIGVTGIVSYVWRYKYFPSRYDMTMVGKLLLAFGMLALLLLKIMFDMKVDDAELARTDLAAYRAGEFVVEERPCEELDEYINDNNG